eukprot:6213077-Pleurochrysis_carterae.AAC.1
MTYQAGDSRRVDVNMDATKFAEMTTQLVFPAIRAKLPHAARVRVQWDNATPHKTGKPMQRVVDALPAPVCRAKQAGPELIIFPQCANSPDQNALDLGFNKSLDSKLPKCRPNNLDEFEALILEELSKYPSEKLNDLFDSKKNRVCQSVVADKGDNAFKIPHRRNVE